jgi:N-acetyl-alpha-D-glucosaminyl L-malate synthase BshA
LVKRELDIALVFYPTPGGSGVIASELAAGLVRRGHRVHVIASAPPSRPLPQDSRLSFHQVATLDYPLFEQPPYALTVAEAIIDVATRKRLDLVHVHYAVPHAASAYLARQALGELAPRIVTTLHGTDVTGIGTQPELRRVMRFAVTAADGLTVPSAFLRDEARRRLQLPAERPIEVIANFVDTDRFAPATNRDRRRLDSLFGSNADSDGPLLVHVSNLRAVKRPTDLVEVLVRIRRRLPARLLIVGSGPERERVEQRAKELKVTDNLRLLGSLPDVADLLKHADAFVLPSESESFGVAALEALSAGVPVCAYRVGGLSDLIDDEVGRLVAPFDLEALAAAVIEVVGNPQRREQLGAAARAMVLEKFRLEPAIDRYEAYYRRVLHERET